RARGQRLEREVADEPQPQVLDDALAGTRHQRLAAHRPEVVTLAPVPAVGDDLGAVVVLLDPGDDDRRVETARVGEDDLLDLDLRHDAPHETSALGARSLTGVGTGTGPAAWPAPAC